MMLWSDNTEGFEIDGSKSATVLMFGVDLFDDLERRQLKALDNHSFLQRVFVNQSATRFREWSRIQQASRTSSRDRVSNCLTERV